jgi:hypothetical protein
MDLSYATLVTILKVTQSLKQQNLCILKMSYHEQLKIVFGLIILVINELVFALAVNENQ